MQKVLVVTDNYPPKLGGISNTVHLLCRSLNAEDVVVLCPCQGDTASWDSAQAFPVYRIPYQTGKTTQTLLSVLGFVKAARGIVRKERIDLVYLAKPWPVGLVGLLNPKPYIVHAYGNDVLEMKGTAKESLLSLTLRRALRVIVISEFTKERVIERGVQPHRTVLIRPKVDFDRFQGAHDSERFRREEDLGDQRIILHVGNVDSIRKGADYLIQAMPRIIKKVPDALLVIIGAGDTSRLEMLVPKNSVANNVRILGPRPENVVTGYFRECELFAMPSRYIREKGDVEGFGIVFLEANACGKAVIGGNSGGIPDAVVDSETGLLVDPDDVEDIAAKITLLLEDQELARRLGRNGYERVKRQFTLDKYGVEFCKKVLEPLQG